MSVDVLIKKKKKKKEMKSAYRLMFKVCLEQPQKHCSVCCFSTKSLNFIKSFIRHAMDVRNFLDINRENLKRGT